MHSLEGRPSLDSGSESRVSAPPRPRPDGWGVWGEGIPWGSGTLAFHRGSKEDAKVLTCSSQVWEGDKEQVVPRSGLAGKGATPTGCPARAGAQSAH